MGRLRYAPRHKWCIRFGVARRRRPRPVRRQPHQRNCSGRRRIFLLTDPNAGNSAKTQLPRDSRHYPIPASRAQVCSRLCDVWPPPALPAAPAQAKAPGACRPDHAAGRVTLASRPRSLRRAGGAGRGVRMTFDESPHPILTPQTALISAESKSARTSKGSIADSAPARLTRRVAAGGHRIGNPHLSIPACRLGRCRDPTTLTARTQVIFDTVAPPATMAPALGNPNGRQRLRCSPPTCPRCRGRRSARNRRTPRRRVVATAS